ncbi:hypothetical protein MESS2_1470010 [Mesorhizobium metallidurans STM 2683]|uniref:Uncharacterized protein n=1 Tax=Mesorhizobium metallidurans STM 2683 TaxID=1297569 RepID=M5EJP7_9HYPH|nr:hypothetical protein MESS2_1470010 [Mesorhizobium metallidurans STM 2683]
MNMVASIKSAEIRGAENGGAEARSDTFSRLKALIAARPRSLDAARAEAPCGERWMHSAPISSS